MLNGGRCESNPRIWNCWYKKEVLQIVRCFRLTKQVYNTENWLEIDVNQIQEVFQNIFVCGGERKGKERMCGNPRVYINLLSQYSNDTSTPITYINSGKPSRLQPSVGTTSWGRKQIGPLWQQTDAYACNWPQPTVRMTIGRFQKVGSMGHTLILISLDQLRPWIGWPRS